VSKLGQQSGSIFLEVIIDQKLTLRKQSTGKSTVLDVISFDLGEGAVHFGSDPNVKEDIINTE